MTEDMLERWLAARDAKSLRSAWTALAPRVHTMGSIHRKLDAYGAAQLAFAMLGERPDWITEIAWRTTPDVAFDREADASFLDHVYDAPGRVRERWKIYERRAGVRGVQVVSIDCTALDGPPEGGVNTVVRIVDRDRAASVLLDSNQVATAGEVDLSPVTLFACSRGFEMTGAAYDISTLRGIVAQLAAELDAHYDTSTLWPAQLVATQPDSDANTVEHAFGDGERSIAMRVVEGGNAMTMASVHGMPWGHKLDVYLQPRQGRLDGSLWVRLPDADIDRVVTRLGAIAQLT